MSFRKMLLEWTAISLVVVTLNFSRQFAVMIEESNRFFAHWGLTENLLLIGLVSVLSFVGICIAVVVNALNSPWITKIFQHLFLIVLASGLLTFYQFAWRDSGWIIIIWLMIMSVVGFSLGYPESRLPKFAKVFCLMLSPMIPILFIQMFTLSTWDTAPQSHIAFEESDRSKSPIFFFIFDAWSFGKSTIDGEFHPYFENLNRFNSKAFVFRQARSPGVTTKQSLPMILYQEDISIEEYEIFKPWLNRDSAEASNLSSLFKRARAQNYSTALVGIYFPYTIIFWQ